MRVDPASPEFLKLSPRAQARIFYFDIGWDEPSIADELGANIKTVERWLDSEDADLPTMRPRKPRINNVRGAKPVIRARVPVVSPVGEVVSPETLRALYVGEGLSMQQIADRFGRSYSWARDQLLQSGIKSRSKGHRGITEKRRMA